MKSRLRRMLNSAGVSSDIDPTSCDRMTPCHDDVTSDSTKLLYDFSLTRKQQHEQNSGVLKISGSGDECTAAMTTITEGESISFASPSFTTSSSSTASRTLRTSSSDSNDSSSTHETAVTRNHNDSYYNYGPRGSDPYADARERIESLRQRKHHDNLHNDDDVILEDHQGLGKVVPPAIAYLVYLSYAVLIFVGHVRDFFASITGRGRFLTKTTNSKLAPLMKGWETFYTRRLYSRIQDVFNRPIASNPGSQIIVLERVSYDHRKSMELLGSLADDGESDTQSRNKLRAQFESGPHFAIAHDGNIGRRCINLGSYNYLGFADDWQATCAAPVKQSLLDFPVSASSSLQEYGTTSLHRQLEQKVAEFLGKEDAIVMTMGFNTNATTIPALVARGDLIISDELNHTSIVNGVRASGAAIRIFRHNDMEQLEKILKESVIMGRPRVRRPWNKILIIVEGIYSMEGEFCNLPKVVAIAKKYGAYVYLDEAHSIGATGLTGRGCSEHAGVSTSEIDIMMGTFTKSFGGMGGYIAADRNTIAMLRNKCAASIIHNALSPPVCEQVLTSLKVIMGEDGTETGRKKLQALRDNSNYFRMRLRDMGFQVLGQYDSPVMPVMLYHPGKIPAFSRECFKRGLAVVVVGFPAVPMLMSRARVCISAGHTRQELDYALEQFDIVGDLLHIKYNNYRSVSDNKNTVTRSHKNK